MSSLREEEQMPERGRYPAIVIFCDSVLVRSLVRESLASRFGSFDVVAKAGIDDLRSVAGRDVRLVVLAARSRDGSDAWMQQVAILREALPAASIMLLCENEERPPVTRAMTCGFRGILSAESTVDILAAAIQLVLAGGTYFPAPALRIADTAAGNGSHRLTALDLDGMTSGHWTDEASCSVAHLAEYGLTARELQVLTQLHLGYPNKMIARALSISENTAKMHVRRIFSKLRVKNRVEAALIFQSRLGSGDQVADT